MSDAEKLNNALDAIRASKARFTFDGEPLNLVAFVEQNAEDGNLADMVDAMAHLRPGAEVLLGGGAGATFIVRRVA